jgi:hypothetical protein
MGDENAQSPIINSLHRVELAYRRFGICAEFGSAEIHVPRRHCHCSQIVQTLELTAVALLFINRIGHARRCIVQARDLNRMIAGLKPGGVSSCLPDV